MNPTADSNLSLTDRRRLPGALVALAALGLTAGSLLQAAPIVSATEHIRLGFNAAFPFSEGRSDSYDGCPFVPPGLPAGVSYNVGVSGTINVHVDMGVDVTFQYDKAGVVAGATLPLGVTYTPTAGHSPNIDIEIPATFHIEGCIVECLLPDICGSVDIPCTFRAGPTGFIAPLTGDAPIVVPVESCVVSLNIAGILDVGSATVDGTITLTPVPVGGLGIGGAVAGFGVSGPGSAPVIPLLQWDTSGQTVDANVELDNPLPGSADITVTLSPVVHWVATAANLRIQITLGSVLHDLGISDPSDIQIFADDLGPVFTQVGLDTQVSDAVIAAVGFDPGFGTAIAAGNLPVPLTNPEIQSISPGVDPVLGSLSFTFNTDVTPPVSSASVAPPPTGFGWNNTPVTVSISSFDPAGGSGVDRIIYSATGANPIPSTTVPGANTAFGVVNPGITTVSFHAVDNEGNVETTKTLVVRIDVNPPTITIIQPAATTYTHSETLTLDYSVIDTGGAGLDVVTVLLNGSPTLAGHGLVSGQAIDLLTELPLGLHTFTIDASDRAGNLSTASVTFEIIVTAESIKEAVNHFLEDGKIKNAGLATSLLAKLNAAANARAKGKCDTAANNYNAFINEVNAQRGTGIDETAADILIADAEYLIANCP
jgi:hypothetical protein